MNHAYIKPDELLTVIEIGTATIKVLMATVTNEGKIEILARGEARTNRSLTDNALEVNVRKGQIREVSAVQQLLQVAVNEAEQSAGRRIQEGYIGLGVTGEDIHVKEVSATITLDPHATIKDEDVVNAGRFAWNKVQEERNEDEFIMGTYSCGYRLDNGEKIGNPAGAVSGNLTARIHCVVMPMIRNVSLSQLMTKVFGNVTQKLIFNYLPMAAGLAVWTGDEHAEGVLSVDIGAGVTSYSVYKDELIQTGNFRVGCEHIENDLMCAFGISRSEAHQILCQSPEQTQLNIMNPNDRRDRLIAFERQNRRRGRRLPVSSIELVVRLRLQEIFQMIKDELAEHKTLGFTTHGVALSGGAALIPGALDLAETVFGVPVRMASARQDIFQADPDLLNNPREIVPLGCLVKLLMDVQTERAKKAQRAAGEESMTSFLKKRIGHFWKTIVNW